MWVSGIKIGKPNQELCQGVCSNMGPQLPGHTAEEWQASDRSLICIYHSSPSLTLLPELRKISSGLPLILHYGEAV